jgi:hypothetical protein
MADMRDLPVRQIDRGAYSSIELDRSGLIDVRYAPTATSLRGAAE